MEEFSRRVLVALVVASAGPAAAMLTFLLVAPTLVAASAPQTESGDFLVLLGSLLVGVMIGGVVSAVIAYLVAAAATLVALRATGCARPHRALVLYLALSPIWIGVLSTLDLSTAGFLVLFGVLPGAIRLGFGDAELRDDQADLVSPTSPAG